MLLTKKLQDGGAEDIVSARRTYHNFVGNTAPSLRD